jgi:hypothetical protein
MGINLIIRRQKHEGTGHLCLSAFILLAIRVFGFKSLPKSTLVGDI